MSFTEKDLIQFSEIGISPEIVEQQIQNFVNGFPFVSLLRAATVDDGIVSLTEDELEDFEAMFEQYAKKHHVLKFVPASGAASRMFKELFNFLKDPSKDSPMYELVTNFTQFAFSDDINQLLENEHEDPALIAELILTEKGLNYGNLPKGLIKFHQYADQSRTAFEEHLVEGAHYSQDDNGNVLIHFTVSPSHQEAISEHINSVIPFYESLFGVNYNISYSTQSKATDTVAVDEHNEPFRNPDERILFRPAGHGALISNLNDLNADIVFIKNIDNVVPDRLKGTTYLYKKALAGYLTVVQRQVFYYLGELDKGINDEELNELKAFASSIGIVEPETGHDPVKHYQLLLNRPIRICGMVKNEGEPGGGPFWIKDQNGNCSLQVVETSQIDLNNEEQAAIVKHATHFNPVDLICATKNYKGEKFDLLQYTDPSTGFISNKSKDGKTLKAQELPGLWNGAMANWITLFVEVPVITFNPVKTVKDLLRDEHLPEKVSE